jgi:opacity protein-like surface antigen
MVSFAENIPSASNDANAWKYYIGMNMGMFLSEAEIHDDSFVDFGVSGALEFGARYNRYRVGVALKNAAEVSGVFQALFGHTIGMENISLRLNGYYDYVSRESFAMYIGAGLGANHYDYEIKEQYNGRDEHKRGFSFVAGANTGMSFGGGHMRFDIGFGVDYITFPNVLNYGPTVGLRYNF